MTRETSRDDSYLDSFLESAFHDESGAGELSVAESPDEQPEAPPPEILARYPVAEMLGRGGVGVVYRAHDSELGRDVAIKILSSRFANDPEAVARFEDEARITSRLQHPGVVPIHELGRLADGRPYFTMKIVAGETLADRLSTSRDPRTMRAAMEVVERVAQTLALAHSRGILHGDVKPGNIMVGAFGEVQLMDWGFARETDAIADRADDAPRARVVGTPSYMSPEQARGDLRAIGPAADVFGLGAILCELLTGNPPYQGDSRSEILLRASKGWIDDARARLVACDADPALVELVARCLDPDPTRRPSDASEVARSIHEHLASVEARARAAELESAKARAAVVHERKARKLTVLLAAAVLLAVAIPAILLYASERASQRRGELADRALASASGRARVLLDQARSSTRNDSNDWAAAIGAAREIRSLAASPDASREATVAAAVLVDAIDREFGEATHRHGVLSRLEELRPHGRVENPVETDREYVRCFVDLGCDLDGDDVAASAERLAALTCIDPIVDALDELTLVRLHHRVPKPEAWRTPRALANSLDSDPVRVRIRDALVDSDPSTLLELARSATPEHDVRTLNLLARALVEAGRSDDAAKVYRIASTRYPGHYWTHHDLASMLFLDKKPPHQEIVRLYAMALAVRPDHPHALTDLGRALAIIGDNASAVQLLSRAARIEPEDGRIRFLLGGAHQGLKDDEAACAEFRHAIDLGNGLAIAPLAQSLLRQGDFAGTVRVLETAERISIPELSMRVVTALKLSQVHRFVLSDKMLEPLLERSKIPPEVIRIAIQNATELGQFDTARARLENAARLYGASEIDPEGRFDAMTRQNLEYKKIVETSTDDEILEGHVSTVTLAAITAQRLGLHERALALNRALYEFDPKSYEHSTGALTFSALRSASIVTIDAAGPEAESNARFAYTVAGSLLEMIDRSQGENALAPFNALELLLAADAIEPFRLVRTRFRDDAFENRFDGMRKSLVEQVRGGR